MIKIKTKLVLKPTNTYEATCDSCGNKLERVMAGEENLQYDDALIINFDGGYGMYIDPMIDNPYGIICKECTDKLFKENPFLMKILKGENKEII